MTTRRYLKTRQVLPALAMLALVAVRPAVSLAFEVQCGPEGGDAFGWSIASGRDYDGDGKADIAIGAPCASAGSLIRAGRIRIFSGADGHLLHSEAGTVTEQQLGSALEWIDDLDGDGKAELVVGSATLTVPRPEPTPGVILGAGRVDVLSSSGAVLWSAEGTSQNASFGESIAVLPDLNGDGKQEVAVGASGAQVSGKVRGSAYLLSGADGHQLARSNGVNEGDLWGSLVGFAGDADGDGTGDWFASTKVAELPAGSAEAPLLETTTTTTTTTTLAPRAGQLTVFSGEPPYSNALRDYFGDTLVDRLGRSAAVAGDWDGDGRDDLWIGSPGAEPADDELDDAGKITLFSPEDSPFLEILEPTPQRFAAFGTSIVVPGSINGDATNDVIAGAPLAKIPGKLQAGRVHAFNGTDGSWMWTVNGDLALERFGQTLATGLDYDGDGVQDILVGAPGDAPGGKRGAGAVYILSGGKSGARLEKFAGRRGRETRIFVAGTDLSREPVVQSYDPYGHRREADLRPVRGRDDSRLSMAILNEGRRQETQNGARTLLAIGAGSDATSPEISVYRASRRRRRVSLFAAGPAAYHGGLAIAAGEFASDTTGDELAVAPSAPNAGSVPVQIYSNPFVDPDSGELGWTELTARKLTAFAPTDTFNSQLINANGGNVVAADLTVNTGDEIVVAPAAGLPVVRLFGRTLAKPNEWIKLNEWLAYPSQGYSGVSVAIGDLDGEGEMEIVTAPSSHGQIWVRAWKAGGKDPFQYAPGLDVSFTIKDFGAQFAGGCVVSTADVDFDGKAEILIAPGKGAKGEVRAYEADGKPVAGWVPIRPFGPLEQTLGLIATDQFWKP